ncbi:hypothetical protein [Nocardia sp. BMG111209]|uniref:hypothetical protein n=1 Tax=Nocardia sp. BMG111209 TaxID=1160137 RepID=UPI000361EA23|nr:hypothetical protein [Nocardia sp. BMG111209]
MFENASRIAADAAHALSETLAKAGRTVADNCRRFGGSASDDAKLFRARDAELADSHRNMLSHNGDPTPIPTLIAETGWHTDSITLRAHTTDTGTVIPPRTWSQGTANAPPPFHEGLFASRAGLTELFRMNIEAGVRLDRLESLTPINPHFNCHGYTFSRNGEAGWLAGRRVEDILSDNGFREISATGTAVPGDVVIYRDDGIITHSGVVADTTSEGIQVISKQGPLSVVRHRLDEVTGMYGPDVSIHHTARPGGRFLTPVANSAETAPPWPATRP